MPESKFARTNSDAANVTSVETSATPRTARSDEAGTSSTSSTPASGRNSVIVSHGISDRPPASEPRRQVPEEPDHADQEQQRVPPDHAVADPTHSVRGHAEPLGDEVPSAVDHLAVDDVGGERRGRLA